MIASSRQDEGPAVEAWSPPATASAGGRRRFLARVRGRLMRPAGRSAGGDAMQELHVVFHRQITFIARHPEVPRRLLAWLADEARPGLQRRVRGLVDHYTRRLTWMIARAKEDGAVRVDVDPEAAATILVGIIQRLARGATAAPVRRRPFEVRAARAFAGFRGALATAAGPGPQPDNTHTRPTP